MIKLVVFDMAGTTVRDGDAVKDSFRDALAARGIQVDPAIVKTVMGLPKPTAIRILLEQVGAPHGVQPTPENIDVIHSDFTRRMCTYYAENPAVGEIPGASAVFAELRGRGIKVALNTGFFRPIVDVLLNRLGWRAPEVVDAVITSDEVPNGRPQPDMILALMKKLGISASREVAKIGDTKVDLEEGANAGCGLIIGVTTGSSTRDQLKNWPHTHIIDSVADLPALIAQQK